MKNTGVNEKALDEFCGTIAELEKKLDALKAHVENRLDLIPEEINWERVRETKRVLWLVNEASKLAGVRIPG
ncbi:hypothetical protein [Selenomonas sp. oral taxon 136]|uniref:hypothetical protein n=1 Tax=Selenomonas sp. oral taxon 136 TaxID=713030 RepID=UPI000768326E|nr:hypothetical protein [Selenomonas sp. oral taxon 136]AME03636.1 hypothetical protein AXE86_05880 [Selenomonas sp. oral taxon 136]